MARAVRRAHLIQERQLAAARRRRRGVVLRAPSSMPVVTGAPAVRDRVVDPLD
ncbi:hypothetical protein [Quadrisphaera sp. DSM 44207]|uniref:hypothetical protein n=1 Tax=Quadrisphaera sp. DSM 44207 TaxID=1881057 RepID=UPI000886941C|nr:hypothetical protein [Quadrisphaera sp. DSM 44207]SDQ85473.1 hypothetical protein SAMN05428996_2905 [Quadrisphaera sp. DSM 44207]